MTVIEKINEINEAVKEIFDFTQKNETVKADFDEYLPHFKKLIPNEYKKMLTLSAKLEEKGLTSEQAQMEAFYESIGAKH